MDEGMRHATCLHASTSKNNKKHIYIYSYITLLRAIPTNWGSRCRGYVGSVSVLFICWGGPLGDLGLQMSGICGVCICSFHLLGRPSWRPGAPAVGDMWGLYLFFSSVGAALLATWGSSCRGYVGSVSVLFIWCWGGKKEEKERRREVDLRLNSNKPNLKGGEK